MFEEFKPLLTLLGGDHGWIATIIVWIGALRLAAKPFSVALLGLFNRAVKFVQESPEQDDDAFLGRLIASRWYRVLAFFVDYLASIKLPTTTSLTMPAAGAGRVIVLLLLLSLGGLTLGTTMTGCRTAGAAQAGVTSPKALTFLAAQDTWALSKAYMGAFAFECASGNQAAIAQRADIDQKFDGYRHLLDTWLALLGTEWSDPTPENQAKLAAEIIDLIKALGIKPRSK